MQKYLSRMQGPYGMVCVGEEVTVCFYYGRNLQGTRYPSEVFPAKVLSIIVEGETHWIHVRNLLSGDSYYPLVQHVWKNA